jgi:hypothetical protein
VNTEHLALSISFIMTSNGQEVIIETMSRINILKEYAPDLFVTNYARICQTPVQPVLLKEEDIPAWEAQTFTNRKGEVEHRKVLRFPLENPKYIFGASTDTYPYVGLKKNTILSNRDQYPFVPCCFRSKPLLT